MDAAIPTRVKLPGGPVCGYATAFDAIVALLPHCTPQELQQLKLTEIAAVQRSFPVVVVELAATTQGAT